MSSLSQTIQARGAEAKKRGQFYFVDKEQFVNGKQAKIMADAGEYVYKNRVFIPKWMWEQQEKKEEQPQEKNLSVLEEIIKQTLPTVREKLRIVPENKCVKIGLKRDKSGYNVTTVMKKGKKVHAEHQPLCVMEEFNKYLEGRGPELLRMVEARLDEKIENVEDKKEEALSEMMDKMDISRTVEQQDVPEGAEQETPESYVPPSVPRKANVYHPKRKFVAGKVETPERIQEFVSQVGQEAQPSTMLGEIISTSTEEQFGDLEDLEFQPEVERGGQTEMLEQEGNVI